MKKLVLIFSPSINEEFQRLMKNLKFRSSEVLPLEVFSSFDVESENSKSVNALASGFDTSVSSFSSAIDELDGRFNERFDIGCERALTACKILC